jgi:cytochrome c peroxidase
MDAMAKMRQDRISDPAGAMQDIERTFPTAASFEPMLSFLLTLTDPCAKSRECLAPWIPTPTEAPDAHQLNAYRQNGQPL